MLNNKDYSSMTLEELEAAEKNLKSPKNIFALVMGFFVGLAVWSASHKGGAITYLLLFLVILMAMKSTKDLKKTQEEIQRRKGGED